MSLKLAAVLAVSASLLAPAAIAQEFKSGDITIESPWARATPKGADVGGAYFTVRNNGATPDRLTGGTADFASVEIHQMKSEDSVMTMRELTGGLNLPAHGTVRFAPGGYHIMFTHLTKPFAKGDKLTATMIFEKAGPIVVEFRVEGIGASGASGAMKGHDMKGMDMKGMDMKN